MRRCGSRPKAVIGIACSTIGNITLVIPAVMPCVSLIFTIHEEQGSVNADALCGILVRVRPEVIFLEVPPAAFDDFYLSRRRHNLESDAVHFFLKTHPQTKLVPVDLPTPTRDFFEDHEQLCRRVREASREYRQLMKVDWDRQRLYGFAYLNSDYCSQHWSDIRTEMLTAVARIGDPRLREIQQEWDRTNELREIEMLANIQECCTRHHFQKAALLVGAAHRQSLIEKLRVQSLIKWSLLESSSDT